MEELFKFDEEDENPVAKYHSLVRYSNPVLILKHTDTKKDKDKAPEKTRQSKAGYKSEEKSEQHSQQEAQSQIGSRQGEFKHERPITAGAIIDTRRETENVLNKILPPRCWEEDGLLWQQAISTIPATRQDVVNLQELLDTRLNQTAARETGICPTRRQLYSQCFDELIRQVTINCSELGLLLLRVRDEVSLSINSYEALYCSSVAFGMRKALQTHEEKEMLRERVKKLETEKDILQGIINDSTTVAQSIQQEYLDQRTIDEKKFREESSFIKKAIGQLKIQLENITVAKK